MGEGDIAAWNLSATEGEQPKLLAKRFLRLDTVRRRPDPTPLVEAAGRVMAEAMFCGLPVICSRDFGFSELIADGVDGFVLDPDDDARIVEPLAALRDDRRLRETIRLAARSRSRVCFGSSLEERIGAAFLGGHVPP